MFYIDQEIRQILLDPNVDENRKKELMSNLEKIHNKYIDNSLKLHRHLGYAYLIGMVIVLIGFVILIIKF